MLIYFSNFVYFFSLFNFEKVLCTIKLYYYINAEISSFHKTPDQIDVV